MATDSAGSRQSPPPLFVARQGRGSYWCVYAPQGFEFCACFTQHGETETPKARALALVKLLNLLLEKVDADQIAGAR